MLLHVRFGALGEVGRFRNPDRVRYAWGDRVVLRTGRGLELGEVLGESDPFSDPVEATARDTGVVLRRTTAEDELLAERIERRRDEAYQACNDLMLSRGFDAVLLEVEHLFDGQSLVFYFLGEVAPELELLTAELAEAYETRAEFRKFSETLTQGCGPGCGTTEAGEGGGCGSCGSCAVAGACGNKRAR